ncbi:MAG: amidase [Bacteroidota bacterium]
MKKLILIFSLLVSIAYAQVSVEATTEGQKILGLAFDPAEIDSMQGNLIEQVKDFKRMREHPLPNSVPPAFVFNPQPVGFEVNTAQATIDWQLPKNVRVPKDKEELAFYTVAELASLIKNRKITSVELTQIYLERLKTYGDTLQCVITITEKEAMQQAAAADSEIAKGQYRGPLHGIPYGVKDLLAYPNYKTTWGAMPYKDQVLEETSTVIQKLEEAGAVMIAKLTLGALAWGDVWYGGKTRNPWNAEQGSSGSSAGSASATSAGLVAFSIGTETLGSIVSPSTRCGNSGLRPSYGRVSRYGAMALSWTMDKIGPICRSAEDCAMVFATITGPDGKDQTLVPAAFNYQAESDFSQMRIGYVQAFFEREYFNSERDQAVLDILKANGAELIPIKWEFETPVGPLSNILGAEAAAAFEELTLTNRDTLLVRQIKNSWPNVFRAGHFVSAVSYIQAMRHRYQLIQEVNALMQQVDVLVVPSFMGNQLLTTNLTGHPAVVVPHGFAENGSPTSITFLGNLFDEATILSFAKKYQELTDHEDQHPEWLK